MRRLLAGVGDVVLERVGHLGGVALLSLATFRRLWRRPFQLGAVLRELERIGWQSMGVVGLLGLFTGMVLVLEIGDTLKRLGAELYVSEGVAWAMIRELGPVLAGFLVAGRVGSGIAAEVGSMAISEQIDAMRSLGADPIKKLVLPKAVAGVVGLPLLTAMANVIGVVGGMVMASAMLNISPYQYINRIRYSLTVGDFMSGVLKAAVFGGIIAMVASYFGLRTAGGTAGVGRSATQSVVVSCVLILVADLMITCALFAMGGVLTT